MVRDNGGIMKGNNKNLSNEKSRKSAFTLAEVLITLGIIGVVAALTIPTLVRNYQKKVTVERLKVAYSQITKAVQLSEAENGDISEWNFNQAHSDFFDRYLLKYIKTTKEIPLNKLENYKKISGDRETQMAISNFPIKKYTTANGTDIILQGQHYSKFSKGAYVYIDINGTAKKPNQYGKDTFDICIDKQHKAYFLGTYTDFGEEFAFESEPNSDRDVLLGKKNPKMAMYGNLYPCSKNKIGTWCGRLIQVDGWKISDDYPW